MIIFTIHCFSAFSEVSGNYEQWITFFLRALKETASDAIDTIDKLTALHARTLKTLQQETPARQMSNMLLLFNYLEKNPIRGC